MQERCIDARLRIWPVEQVRPTGYAMPMKKKRRYLTATMPDGYVKVIGPTTDNFTHYWRIVAELENGKSEVFWGHSRSHAEARRKRAPAEEAARMRGWKSFTFEIAELVETDG